MAISDTLERLGQSLSASVAWWQPSVFADDPPWVEAHPELAEQLAGLDRPSLERLEQHPAEAAQWLSRWLPELNQLDQAVASVDATPVPQPLALPESDGRDIGGRKWQQLLHFAALCDTASHQDGPLLEWCSGKAHLGRLLAQRQQRPLIGIEWQAALCASARSLAQRDGVDLRMRQANVLTTPSAALLEDAREVVALHACGDLHRHLLEAAPDTPLQQLSLAPCCYHLTGEMHYRPLSRQASALGLKLSRLDLRLVTQQVVVANDTRVRRSRELMQWRLAFDWLQRQWRQTDQYLPTPSRSTRVLRHGFRAFIADMAAHHGLPVAQDFEAEQALAAGARQLARGRRLALVRHRFRRALEVWLLLDRAVFLQEKGFVVQVGRFCPFHITPRNLIIRAQRP